MRVCPESEVPVPTQSERTPSALCCAMACGTTINDDARTTSTTQALQRLKMNLPRKGSESICFGAEVGRAGARSSARLLRRAHQDLVDVHVGRLRDREEDRLRDVPGLE